MSKQEELICVGSIAGAYGVRGEVRVKSYTADPEAIEDYNPLLTEDGSRSFDLGILQVVKNGLLVRLSDVTSKEQADALKGVKLYVPRTRLPALPDDEFYYADLMGLEVFDTGGTSLGRVKSVQNHGAGDLLEIHAPGLKATVLLPFSQEVVPTVDLASGRIIADPPDGLFPE